jgi:HEAT repeat protein
MRKGNMFFPDAKVLKKERKKDVKGVIKALRDKDWCARATAAGALGRIGDVEAVEPLIQAMGDTEFDVRAEATEALGKIGNVRAIGPLFQAVKDEERGLQCRAVSALGDIGTPALDYLIQALDIEGSQQWDIRESAVEALGDIGGSGVVGPLVRALEHPRLQDKATKALERIGDPKAVEPLIQTLVERLKRSGVVANIFAERGKAEIAQALDRLGWQAADDTEKAHYLIAKQQWDELEKLGKPAVEPLIHCLHDMDPAIRNKVVKTLGRVGIGDKRALEALKQVQEQDSDKAVRDQALWAVLEIIEEKYD